MKVDHTTLDGGCGVSVLCDFDTRYGEEIGKLTPQGGCGFVVAGFIDGDETSDKAFAECEKRGPCVYKTPTRFNRNSHNEFYMAVFDWSEGEEGRYGFGHHGEDA